MDEWYNLSWNEVVSKLDSDPQMGLKLSQVESLSRNNENNKPKQNYFRIWDTLIKQMRQPWFLNILVLISLSIYFNEIFVVGALIFVFGLVLYFLFSEVIELQKGIIALEKLMISNAVVIREGKIKQVSSEELVIGDIVLLDEGRIAPADLRIIECEDVKVREGMITGEGYVVEKYTAKIAEKELTLPEMKNIVFKGSTIVGGRGFGVVTACGYHTHIGRRIRTMVEAREEPTYNQSWVILANMISFIGVFTVLIGSISALIRMHGIISFVFIRSALAAYMPLEMILVMGIVGLLFKHIFKKRNITFKNLSSFDKMAKVNVICTEDIGSVFDAEMHVKSMFTDEVFYENAAIDLQLSDNQRRLIMTGMLCSENRIQVNPTSEYDLMNSALIRFGKQYGFDKVLFDKVQPKVLEIPYDRERTLYTSINRVEDYYRAYVKGNIDQIIKRCTHIMKNGIEKELNIDEIEKLKEINMHMCSNALTVVGYAYRNFKYKPSLDENVESNLVFVGMIGFENIDSEPNKQSLLTTMRTGIKPIIFMNNNKITAFEKGQRLGLTYNMDSVLSGIEIENMTEEERDKLIEKVSIYTVVSPEVKTGIVQKLTAIGYFVAYFGRRIIDLPSLKASGVGITTLHASEAIKSLANFVVNQGEYKEIYALIEESRKILWRLKDVKSYIFVCSLAQLFTYVLSCIMFRQVFDALGIFSWFNISTVLINAIAIAWAYEERTVSLSKHLQEHERLTLKLYTKVISIGFTNACFALLVAYLTGPFHKSSYAVVSLVNINILQSVYGFIYSKNRKILYKNKNTNILILANLVLQEILLVSPLSQFVLRLQGNMHLDVIRILCTCYIVIILYVAFQEYIYKPDKAERKTEIE